MELASLLDRLGNVTAKLSMPEGKRMQQLKTNFFFHSAFSTLGFFAFLEYAFKEIVFFVKKKYKNSSLINFKKRLNTRVCLKRQYVYEASRPHSHTAESNFG